MTDTSSSYREEDIPSFRKEPHTERYTPKSKQSRREKEISEEPAFAPYVHDSYDDFEIDRDFTSRLISTAIGGQGLFYKRGEGDVRDNIYTQSASFRNRPEPLANPNLSRRSRKVIRDGYDLGFQAPGLKLLFEVK